MENSFCGWSMVGRALYDLARRCTRRDVDVGVRVGDHRGRGHEVDRRGGIDQRRDFARGSRHDRLVSGHDHRGRLVANRAHRGASGAGLDFVVCAMSSVRRGTNVVHLRMDAAQEAHVDHSYLRQGRKWMVTRTKA